jgi:hypothetical protein
MALEFVDTELSNGTFMVAMLLSARGAEVVDNIAQGKPL